MVKNLFFNIPARRKFLKSNPVELKHITEEFERIALANPEIELEFINNEDYVYQLKPGNYRKRIVGLFGSNYDQRIAPMSESTSIVQVSGFVGKPEFARKTKGEQFIFVNNRFIRSNYIHHAISSGYQELIQKEQYPSYFIYLSIDPSKIDINIHPTKTEIKFEDEKEIYTIVHCAVKRAIGINNLSPTIDFDQVMAFNVEPRRKSDPLPDEPPISSNKEFNPFHVTSPSVKTNNNVVKPPANWQALFDGFNNKSGIIDANQNINEQPNDIHTEQENLIFSEEDIEVKQPVVQINRKYILSTIKCGFVVIHQQRAHERVLYEHFIERAYKHVAPSQQLIFPVAIDLSINDITVIAEQSETLKSLGFELRLISKHSIAVEGVPPEAMETNIQQMFEGFVENLKNSGDLDIDRREIMARVVAKISSIKSGVKLEPTAMRSLINELFACQVPFYSPDGKPAVMTNSIDFLDKYFE